MWKLTITYFLLSIFVINASYWSVKSNGFFPNSLTEMKSEKDLEHSYDKLSFEMCKIGYLQNPTGGTTTPIKIPSSTTDILKYAQLLHREPATTYSTLVLNNCFYIGKDDDYPNKLNWIIYETVSPEGSQAYEVEKGFYASHCEVERQFAKAINTINKFNSADSTTILTKLLQQLSYEIRIATSSLKHMRHFFEPDLFFKVLRPYLKCGNIGENGVIFECDVEESMCNDIRIELPSGNSRIVKFNEVIYGFRGPTGAMTSSLSAIDAALGIKTSISADKNLESTMNDFKEYQPVEHVKFIQKVGDMNLRNIIIDSGNHVLIDAYNSAVTSVAEFRFGHMDHVMTYIFKSISHVPPKYVTGTGNTPIVSYLCKSALGTLGSLIIGEKTSQNLPSISIPSICQTDCYKETQEIFNDKKYCDLIKNNN